MLSNTESCVHMMGLDINSLNKGHENSVEISIRNKARVKAEETKRLAYETLETMLADSALNIYDDPEIVREIMERITLSTNIYLNACRQAQSVKKSQIQDRDKQPSYDF